MKPHTSYLICATCRTGSYLLCEALENTGVAGKPSEYFRGMWGSTYETFLGEAFAQGLTPNGVFGAKIMMNYFDKLVRKLKQLSKFRDKDIIDSALLSFAFPNLHYIWITRRNKIRQAVSLYKALLTGDWGHEVKAVSRKPLEFNPDVIDHILRQFVIQDAAWEEYFTQSEITPFVVVYEDFVQNYEITALQILKYLDISIPPNLVFGKRKFKKQADALSEEWIQRYRALKQMKWPGNVCGM